jgi:NAD-dependent SIR2 family protein deacetylase
MSRSSVINGMNLINNIKYNSVRKEVLTKYINKQLFFKKIRQNNQQLLINQQNHDNLEQQAQNENLNLEIQPKIKQNSNKKYSVGKIQQKGKITILQ